VEGQSTKRGESTRLNARKESEKEVMAEAARALDRAEKSPAQLELVAALAEPAPPRDPEQLPLLPVVLEIVRSIHAGQRSMAEELRAIKTSLPMQRKPLSRRTMAIHIHATLTRRNGLCPCCQETPVCDANGRLQGAEFDHFFARDKNRVGQVWLTCGACNRRLIDTDFKAAARSAFEAYQAALKPLLSKQLPMDLREK
jgi:hypothetical protein